MRRPWCRMAGQIAGVATALALGATAAPAEEATLETARPDDTWVRAVLDAGDGWPDLGHLNHRPAGRHGVLRAEGPDLVFDDGTPARFWGTNLSAYALFRTPEQAVCPAARRIASLGFNLVRIHHHDSAWVNPNVFGTRGRDTRTLDPSAMASLDLWISCLAREGIYVWLDLHVGRRLTPADAVAAQDEMPSDPGGADLRGFNFVNADIRARMLAFQQAYLGHRNRLNGLTYAEDPAVVAVLVTNENDLTHHFAGLLLPGKGRPMHAAWFRAAAEAHAARHGADPDALMRFWTFGPAKAFLNDLEHDFFAEMMADVRASGFGGLIAPTSLWGGMSAAGLPALSTGDIIDVHSYAGISGVTANPATEADFLAWAAIAQVAGMPLSVSEWNVTPATAPDRFAAPLRMAAIGRLQGWDAPMVFGYAQAPLPGPERTDRWTIANDPAMLAMMPAAALMFREGHVAGARRTFALTPDANTLLGTPITPRTSAALRTLVGRSRVVLALPPVPELPWMTPRPAPPGAIAVEDLDRSFLDPDADAIVSDTGELRHDPTVGVMTIDTARSQAALGRIGGRRHLLSDVEIAVDTPMAAVAVQALDDRPIREARRLMISVGAQSLPVEARSLPFLTQPVKGHLRVRAPAGLVLKRLAGGRAMTLAHRTRDGWHEIDLDGLPGVQWLILAAPD